MHGRNVDMLKLADMHGENCRSLGYRSMGESVPDVIITLPKRLKSGAIARDESRHASCIPGLSPPPGTVPPPPPPTSGSIITAKRGRPSEYVDTRLAKSATSVNAS